MATATSRRMARVQRFTWIAIASISALYAAFALAAAAGLVEANKIRAAPNAFVVHAVAGGVALLCGAAQFNAWIRQARPGLHRAVGRIYVLSACLASLSGMASAARFDVGVTAQVSFQIAAALWLGATAFGWIAIRRRRIVAHTEWMTRSYALALFFVTFSFWTPLLASFDATRNVAYPLGVTLSWTLNLVVAEALIRWREGSPGGGAAPRQPQ